jgi:hypothetical protein
MIIKALKKYNIIYHNINHGLTFVMYNNVCDLIEF